MHYIKNIQQAIKIISANLIFFVICLITLEFGLRGFRTLKDCYFKECNLEHFKFAKKSVWVGISSPHEELGYTTAKNLNLVVNYKGWENIKITTDDLGLRNSGKIKNNSENLKKILTVGDSFTFGDQVSDNETWQYCLNKEQNKYFFLNGGVSGYGTAQALLRSEILSKKINPDLILISTLVGHDFHRDQAEYRTGFPMSPVILKDGIIRHNLDIDPDVKGSKFYTGKYKGSLITKLAANSELIQKYFIPFKRKEIEYLTKNLNRRSKSSPSKNEIIKWTINKSNKLKVPVIWLLQYSYQINDEFLEERKTILNNLENNNIPYIDSYDTLHGSLKTKNITQKAWINKKHHSVFGNDLVCKIIYKNLNLLSEFK